MKLALNGGALHHLSRKKCPPASGATNAPRLEVKVGA